MWRTKIYVYQKTKFSIVSFDAIDTHIGTFHFSFSSIFIKTYNQIWMKGLEKKISSNILQSSTAVLRNIIIMTYTSLKKKYNK